MISIEDLKRFDVWAVERGYSDPSRYMAACEAFEAQQVIIDELKAGLQPDWNVIAEPEPYQQYQMVVKQQQVTPAPKGKRPPGNYHKKRGANGRFA